MELTFATPALLFPAVSLLFLSYTNRFLSYADLVRRLHERRRSDSEATQRADSGPDGHASADGGGAVTGGAVTGRAVTGGEASDDTAEVHPAGDVLTLQITNLRRRILLIRNMQIFGAVSLLLCVACMIALFLELTGPAEFLFALALVAMLISLTLLVVEVGISVRALELQLGDLEKTNRAGGIGGHE